ncbi:MAG: hypothetical protein QXJ75_05580 [Candidatus Bathyarchaeia archaeon]
MTHRGRRSAAGEERRRLWREAYYDVERAEEIAMGDYPSLRIERGEVLRSPTYLNPSLRGG